MKIEGILFDFDGVVVKSMEQHFDAWKKAFAEKGVEIRPDEFYILEGQGIHTISHKIGRDHGLTPDQVEEIKERKMNYYNQFMTIEFYDYFGEMLQALSKRGVPMGIVTGGVRERVIPILEKYFNGEFSCVVTVDDVKRGKPFPDPFLAGARKLHLPAESCIVVENAPMGIEGAKKAGMTVIAITTTLTDRFLSQADSVCHNFQEVSAEIDRLL